MEEEPARRCGCVDLVSDALEVSSPALQLIHEKHEVFHRSPEPIQLVDSQDISRPKMRHDLLQTRTIGPCPTHAVLEDPVTVRLTQGRQLEVKVLIFG